MFANVWLKQPDYGAYHGMGAVGEGRGQERGGVADQPQHSGLVRARGQATWCSTAKRVAALREVTCSLP